MNKPPLFSIIVPTYNSADKLKKALDSVCMQTFNDFEVIVCDDGSTDHTREVVDSFADKINIKYIRQENWGGPARPRNNGLKVARGEFIAFLDADDQWYPNKLETVRDNVSGADLVYHDLAIFTENGKKTLRKTRGRNLKKPVFVDLMKNENAIFTSGVVVRKKLVDAAGGFLENKSLVSLEDFDLWLKISRITEKFVYIPRCLGSYELNSRNISRASQIQIDRINSLYQRHLPFLTVKDREQSEFLKAYLLGRTNQKLGFLDEAVNLFRISLKSDNLKIKFRSFCWLAFFKLSGFKKLDTKKIINFLFVFGVFSDSILYCFPSLFDLRLVFSVFLVAALLYLPYVNKVPFSRNFLLFFLVVTLTSLLNIWQGNDNFFLFFKQAIGIFLSAFFYYLLIKINEKKLKDLYRIYINLAVFLAFIGILQEVGYWLKIDLLYNFSYLKFMSRWGYPTPDAGAFFFRINSIMPEPSSFCLVMTPAFFASILCLGKVDSTFLNFKKSIIIIISYLLTFSVIGYLGVVFSLIFLCSYKMKPASRVLFFPLIIIFPIISFFAVKPINEKLASFFIVLARHGRLEDANYSAFAFLSNAQVTMASLKNNLLFGNGLGSYLLSYGKIIGKVVSIKDAPVLLNMHDANSLFFRILSELGIVGLAVLLIYILKNLLYKGARLPSYLRTINNGIFILFMLRLIRQGHYFSEGFFFFFWLYYFTKKISENSTHEDTH